jgi:predicted nuclease of predicted toxin-antitoxin system
VAKLYTNENFPLPAVEELRRLGHDVLTVQESGRASQAFPDEEVLEFARAEDRVLVTFNRRHFVRIHQQRSDHSGTIVCTYDPDFIALAQRIDAAIRASPLLDGQLVRINRPATARQP